MAFIAVDNVGETGIVRDINPWQLPSNVWSNGNNVRAANGAIIKSPGYSEILSSCPVKPYHLVQLEGLGGKKYWVIASLEKIYVHDGLSASVWINITRQTAGSDVDYSATISEGWTSTIFAGILVMTNGVDRPQYWPLDSQGMPDTSIKMENLANWLPVAEGTSGHVSCKSLRSFRQFLVAMNLKDNTDYPFNRRVNWSSSSYHGDLPTEWDPEAATEDSGSFSLEDTKGQIVDGMQLSGEFMIYKTDSIYVMSWIGTPMIMSIRQLSPSVGALAKNCVAEFDGGHFFIGNGDIYINDGQRVKSILPHKVRDFLFENIDGEHMTRSFVVADYGRTEMWACFPSSGSGAHLCDKAVIWNWSNNAFTIRDIPSLGHISYGSQGDPNAYTSWYDAPPTLLWQTANEPWAKTWGQTENVLMFASPVEDKIYRNNSGESNDDAPMISYIERTGLSMGASGHNDQSTVKRIRAIWPKMEISGDSLNVVKVSVGTQMSTMDGVSWTTPVEYNPAKHSKVSVRKSGKLYGVKFESDGDFSWRLDGYEIELEDGGRRGSRSY